MAVMINRLISTSLAAKDSIEEHWKSVVMMDQCQSTAKVEVTLVQRYFNQQRISNDSA